MLPPPNPECDLTCACNAATRSSSKQPRNSPAIKFYDDDDDGDDHIGDHNDDHNDDHIGDHNNDHNGDRNDDHDNLTAVHHEPLLLFFQLPALRFSVATKPPLS